MSLDRRRFLSLLGGLSAGVLSHGRPLRAWGAHPDGGPPSRFVVVFTPCGYVAPARFASVGATEDDFTLGAGLSPLERHRSELLFVDGIELPTAWTGPGDPHQKGIAQILTATPVLEGDLFAPFDKGDREAGWGGGPSIDQIVADRLGTDTWLRSLHLGVDTFERLVLDLEGTMVYRDADRPVAPDNDPARAFRRLFGGAEPGATATDADIIAAQRRSVLDAIAGDLQQVRGRLAGEARVRMDRHLEIVRATERRLDGLAPAHPAGACAPPSLAAIPDRWDSTRFGVLGDAQMDVLTAALACDRTRVATLQWSWAGSRQAFPELGADHDHHTLTHETQTEAILEARTRIDAWYAERFAGLLDRLRAVPEGDGTLLDHTVVLWVNEMADPTPHDFAPMPTTLAGGRALGLRPGRRVPVGSRSQNDLLLTVATLFGVELATFGDPEHATGPIDGLV